MEFRQLSTNDIFMMSQNTIEGKVALGSKLYYGGNKFSTTENGEVLAIVVRKQSFRERLSLAVNEFTRIMKTKLVEVQYVK